MVPVSAFYLFALPSHMCSHGSFLLTCDSSIEISLVELSFAFAGAASQPSRLPSAELNESRPAGPDASGLVSSGLSSRTPDHRANSVLKLRDFILGVIASASGSLSRLRCCGTWSCRGALMLRQQRWKRRFADGTHEHIKPMATSVILLTMCQRAELYGIRKGRNSRQTIQRHEIGCDILGADELHSPVQAIYSRRCGETTACQ